MKWWIIFLAALAIIAAILLDSPIRWLVVHLYPYRALLLLIGGIIVIWLIWSNTASWPGETS